MITEMPLSAMRRSSARDTGPLHMCDTLSHYRLHVWRSQL